MLPMFKCQFVFAREAILFHSLAFLFCLTSLTGCSQSPPAIKSVKETQSLSFRGLYYPFLPLEISIYGDNSLTWRDPPDSGGTGRVCTADSEMTCIVLDGGWKFAIPNAAIERALVGQSWTFEQVQYEILSIIQYPSISRQSEILLVKSGSSSTGWIILHFDIKSGLEAITYVHSSWEPDNRDQPFIPVIEVKIREK